MRLITFLHTRLTRSTKETRVSHRPHRPARRARRAGRRRPLDGRIDLARRVLDAESGVHDDHPRLPADRRRQGRLVHAVLRPVGRPGARGRQRPARRRRRPLARARHADARQGRPRRADVEREQVQGHRHALRRRVRLPPGQPEAHPQLERPDQAGRAGADAEPGHVGRRALERPRGLRRAAQARQDAEAGRAST